MNKSIYTIFAFFIIVSCGQTLNTDHKNTHEQGKTALYKVETYVYDSLTIPLFFKTLVKNHLKDFFAIDSDLYDRFCNDNGLKINDTSNIEKYYTIKILHDLFTSKSARNGSRGEILNIPYQWHWVEPNPRHEICFVKNNKLLMNTKPPKEYSKYKSYADIDRTPYLFLSELFAIEPGYYSASCDTFSTFGWCSEREMAFISLTKLLDYKGKIVSEGNHCWSELLIPMMANSGETIHFKVRVDNTFNHIYPTKIESDAIKKWKMSLGESEIPKWYNRDALSTVELQRIQNCVASPQAMMRIEKQIVNYLEFKLNPN